MFKIRQTVFLFFIIISGCAVSVKSGKTDRLSRNARDIVRNTLVKNLTSSGFFIQKGKITTVSGNSKINLLFTMKYSSDNKYLISLRTRSGIEAFRVFISKDTILVNDRINRNVLYGKPDDFEKISGLPESLLKMSVGDLFLNKAETETGNNCLDGLVKLSDYYRGLVINSSVDCMMEKIKFVRVSTSQPGNYITINYKNYKDDGNNVPGKIEINDSGRNIRIIISIEKYVSPWVGGVEFIPGSGYNVKPLI